MSEVAFELMELRMADGGEPDALHEFLIECFLDDSGFVNWSLEELNAMLDQCARKAVCVHAEEDDAAADDALDLIEQAEGKTR